MRKLEVLAIAAGFFLLANTPALAQYTAPASSALAASDNDQSDVSVVNDQTQTLAADDQSQSSAANEQGGGLTDTDWWWEDEGLTVGYLGYGVGSCGAGFQSSRAWQPYTVWWTGNNVNPWSSGESLARFSNQSGWCNNYGYGNRTPYVLTVNRIVPSTRNHHRTRNHKSVNSNSGTPTTARQTSGELIRKSNRELEYDREGADDNWTRVEDHIEYPRPQQTAALARQYHQGIRGLPHGPRSQNPQRARVERMQGLERRHVMQARVLAPPHIGVARPAAHIAARSGGRGHS
jgi:hypothetical protein